MNILHAMAAATLALMAATPVTAGLTGQTASVAYYYPTTADVYGSATATPSSFTIGTGEETRVDVEGVTTIHVDFADQTLGIVFNTSLTNPTWTSAPFNGLIFSGPGFAGITGVTVEPSTSFAGFDASRVSVVGNDLRLNWNSLSYVDGTTLNLSFSGLGATVPEPASWALLVTGFGLIGAATRRRRAVAA